MLTKLVELYRPNAALLERASQVLGRDLAAHFTEDNDQAFNCNVDVQLGVFLANAMVGNILEAAGLRAELSLGLSLGEYNHLVHIGALEFEDALHVVRARGEAYDRGPRGWMASIQPMNHDDLQEVVTELRGRGIEVEIVNLNSPRQNVIAGEQRAVEAAMQLLEDEHYVQPVVIERSVPMHASMFAPVGHEFRAVLERAPFKTPRLPYVPNRLGRILETPTRAQLVDLLATHVHAPVLWRRSIDHVVERYPDAVFVEVGVKQVLTNLMRRKWHKRPGFACDSRDATTDHLNRVLGECNTAWRLPLLLQSTPEPTPAPTAHAV